MGYFKQVGLYILGIMYIYADIIYMWVKLRTNLNACLIRAEIKLLIKRTCIFCSILGAKFTVLFFSKLSFEKNLISFYALDGIDSRGQWLGEMVNYIFILDSLTLRSQFPTCTLLYNFSKLFLYIFQMV